LRNMWGRAGKCPLNYLKIGRCNLHNMAK